MIVWFSSMFYSRSNPRMVLVIRKILNNKGFFGGFTVSDHVQSFVSDLYHTKTVQNKQQLLVLYKKLISPFENLRLESRNRTSK